MSDEQKQTPEEAEAEHQANLARVYPASRQPTTLFVNNFYITIADSFVRIAFGESAEMPVGTQFRTAVALPIDDGRELARILSKMISEADEEAAAANA